MVGNDRRQGEPLIAPGPHVFAGAAILGLAALGCAAGPGDTGLAPPAAPVVAEAWESERFPDANLDSLAAWKTEDGVVWLIATAKEGHQLIVFDAATGATLRRVGAEGDGPGAFRRPNGIAIAGDLCLIVERDNRRVQAFTLPAFEPVALFGEAELKKPYGISVAPSGAGEWDVFVTDAYETASGSVPPDTELGERVKQYRLRHDRATVSATLVRSFGETAGLGALHVVESLEVDPALARILIAEEEETATFIKVYGFDGRFTGQTVGQGRFRHQVEGIALRYCEGDHGWWIVSDQGPAITEFHLLDRRTLEPLGMFVGESTANTDGIAVYTEPFAGFPSGALFAVDDDAAVTAFRWNDLARAFDIDSCSG